MSIQKICLSVAEVGKLRSPQKKSQSCRHTTHKLFFAIILPFSNENPPPSHFSIINCLVDSFPENVVVSKSNFEQVIFELFNFGH